MVKRISDFMDQFYSSISFGRDEKFKSRAFADLFNQDALLVEKTETAVIRKTVAAHIKEFEDCIEHYPQLFTEGFLEKQLAMAYLQADDFVLVKSQYEKRYFRGGEAVVSTGYNNLTLLVTGDTFKIVAIAWME